MLHPTAPTRCTCLDDNLIAGLLEGGLGRSERRLVERHLDACDGCRHLVAELAREVDSSPTRVEGALVGGGTAESGGAWSVVEDDADAPRHSLLPGDRIDHFAIVRLLGRGGMGEVYLARDASLDRDVAIKVISSGQLDSTRARSRFFAEARTTAKLNHPNIVTIHAVGQHAGRPYLALEYVPGRTMRRWLADSASSAAGPAASRGLEIVLSIAEALAAAHRHGVLHRDLKPDNVLIDRDGRVRVLDFGLALMAEDVADSGATLGAGIHTTGIAGTPRYMAPEQWRHEPLTGAVDVWALGVMLYELLSGGVHPFGLTRSDDPSAAQPDDESWSERMQALPETIGEGLRSLVARCLESDPLERPSADEVCRIVREQLARPATSARRARRHPLAALTLAAAAIVASVTGAVWANDGQSERVGSIAPGLTMVTTLVVASSTATSPAAPAAQPEATTAPSRADASPQPGALARPVVAKRSKRALPAVRRQPAESDETLLRQW